MADGKADFKPDYGFPDPDVVIAKMTVGETFGLPAVGYASGMAWAYSFASRSAVCGWEGFWEYLARQAVSSWATSGRLRATWPR